MKPNMVLTAPDGSDSYSVLESAMYQALSAASAATARMNMNPEQSALEVASAAAKAWALLTKADA